MQVRRSNVSSQALRDQLLDELRAAARDLGDEKVPEARRVHLVRRRIKKLRALLRLLQRPLGRAARAAINAELRAVARGLSLARETDVHPQSLAQLLSAESGKAAQQLSGALRGYCRGMRKHLPPLPELLSDTAAGLRSVAEQVPPASAWQAVDADVLREACRLGYQRACASLDEARRSGLADDFHAWRRRVKDHQNHLSLLRKLLPAKGSAVRRQQLDDLAELLGQANDLYELDEVLAALEPAAAGPALEPTRMRLIAALAVARLKALNLGQSLFISDECTQRLRWLDQ